MSDLLLLNASPRGGESESLLLADTLVDAYRSAAPNALIDRIDLFENALPRFDSAAAHAKMKVIGGKRFARVDESAWQDVVRVFDRWNAADTVVFTVPMWNDGIPWALKHFIDTVTQPGLAFGFDPETGYHGLLDGKRAVAIYTSHVYRPGVDARFGVDFHSTYFEHWLRFVGIDDISSIRLQTTYPTPDLDERRKLALAEARALGRALASTPLSARAA